MTIIACVLSISFTLKLLAKINLTNLSIAEADSCEKFVVKGDPWINWSSLKAEKKVSQFLLLLMILNGSQHKLNNNYYEV